MCRLLAYVAPAPRNASEVLGPEQLERFAKLAELHSHGWGAAWVERPGAPVGHHREIADLRAGGAFDVLTQEQPAVAMGLHLRLASSGAVVPANSHPFTHAGISLMHNGTIAPRDRLDALLEPATLAAMTSTTDSERYLGLVADHRGAAADLGAAAASAVGVLRAAHPTASLNAVMIDEAEMVVVHASSSSPDPLEELLAESGTADLPEGHETGYYQMYWRTEADGTVLIASSGLDTAGWTTLPHDSITIFDLTTGHMSLRRIPVGGTA